MKILVWGDAGCNTGFGTVSDNLMRRWAKNGHDIVALAINYRGDPWDTKGYRLYNPTAYNPQDLYGFTRLKEVMDKEKPDIFFVLNDLNVIHQGFQTAFPEGLPVPTVIYTPIDGVGIPPYWVIPARQVDKTILMTEWGAKVIADEFGDKYDYIHHGIDFDSFFPVSEHRPLKYVKPDGTRVKVKSKEQAKRQLNLHGRFVVLAINRNSDRKNYPDTMKAFAEFAKDKPEAILVIHASSRDVGGDLNILADRLKLHGKLVFSDVKNVAVGASRDYISLLYNAADVKLTTSLGEGFGLTDAEALACGVPLVAQNFSATSEVAASGSILVNPVRLYTTTRMVDFAIPDLDEFVISLEKLYRSPELRKELGRQGREYVLRFDWDKAAKKFLESFDEVLKNKKANGTAA